MLREKIKRKLKYGLEFYSHTAVICVLMLEREGTKLSALNHTLCMCMTAVKIPRSLGSC